MPKEILGRAKVHALVGQIIAAGMAQHVRVRVPEPSPLPGGLDDVIDRLPRHLVAALRHEQPRERSERVAR
jgi:hypothetical protein